MRAYFRNAFALIVFFSIEGAAAQQTPNDTVLQTPSDTFLMSGAPGIPWLTESMVDRYTGFASWFLEIPMTPDFRNKKRGFLVQYWVNRNAEEINIVIKTLELEAELLTMPAAERLSIRAREQAEVVRDMRARPDDAEAQFLLSLYDEEHPEGAAGVASEPSSDPRGLWEKYRSDHLDSDTSVPAISNELMRLHRTQ